MTFDIFTAFATDENLENNGTIFKLGKGAEITVARAGNRAYAKAITKAVEARRVELDAADDNAANVSDQIMVDVMAETILLGWKKLSFKGEDMGDYSTEKAKKLLAVKDFRKHVAGLSDQMDAYKVKAEKAAGND
jgi:hypothetical protein